MGNTKLRPGVKSAATEAQSLPEKTFIIDNGGYTMKAGYAPESSPPEDEENILSACGTIPNTVAKARSNRIYIGSQVNAPGTDWNELMFRRPLEKGYIVNWEVQKEIWEHSFFDEKTARSKEMRIASPEETTLVLTESPNALPVLQKNADEMVMEEWGFGGYVRCVGKNAKSVSISCFDFVFLTLFLLRYRSVAECLERSTNAVRRFDIAKARFRYFTYRVSACCGFGVFSYYCDSGLHGTAPATWYSPARPGWKASYELPERDGVDETV